MEHVQLLAKVKPGPHRALTIVRASYWLFRPFFWYLPSLLRLLCLWRCCVFILLWKRSAFPPLPQMGASEPHTSTNLIPASLLKKTLIYLHRHFFFSLSLLASTSKEHLHMRLTYLKRDAFACTYVFDTYSMICITCLK